MARSAGDLDVTWVVADACEVSSLDAAGLATVDVVVAATGDDEDNLVVSLLAKQEFAVPRVVARVNHPKNQWLFTETWGVDVSVSTPQLLTALVEEAVSVGSLVRLLRFEGGNAHLVEVTLADDSPASGRLAGRPRDPPRRHRRGRGAGRPPDRPPGRHPAGRRRRGPGPGHRRRRGRGAAAAGGALTLMRAAFFDLDKTVIAKASIPAFGRPLYRGGLINRRLVARALVSQLIYLHLGASEQKLARVRESMLTLTKGWDRDRIAEIVREALEETVEPIIYAEALDLIEAHRAAGHRVYLVSASPDVIVEPLAVHLGVDGAIASRPFVDEEGRYTGEMEFYAYGPFKAEAIAGTGRARGDRPGRILGLLRLLHRPPDAGGGRPPRRRQPRPAAGQGGQGARVGGDAVHQAGPAPRPGECAQPAADRHRGRDHGGGIGRRTGRLASGPASTALSPGQARSAPVGRSRPAWEPRPAGVTTRRRRRRTRGCSGGRSRLAATTPRATTMARIRSFFMEEMVPLPEG